MAFIPAKRIFATCPIGVSVYNDDGKKIDINFIAQYRRYKKTEIDTLSDALHNKFRILRGEDPIKGSDGTTPTWADVTDVEFIKANLRGWPGIKDDTGKADLPYSEQALEDFLDDFPELVGPLFNGLWEAHRGAQQKN